MWRSWVDMDDGGGVWKKVKSKVTEDSGRYTCVEEKIEKKQKRKKKYFIVKIYYFNE